MVAVATSLPRIVAQISIRTAGESQNDGLCLSMEMNVAVAAIVLSGRYAPRAHAMKSASAIAGAT